MLRGLASDYLCPIAATNGQAGGFLHTEIGPLLQDGERRMLYLGDHDYQGGQIEANTSAVLDRVTGRDIDWRRIAITAEQVQERDLQPIRIEGQALPATPLV